VVLVSLNVGKSDLLVRASPHPPRYTHLWSTENVIRTVLTVSRPNDTIAKVVDYGLCSPVDEPDELPLGIELHLTSNLAWFLQFSYLFDELLDPIVSSSKL